jgi:hypothetical protein
MACPDCRARCVRVPARPFYAGCLSVFAFNRKHADSLGVRRIRNSLAPRADQFNGAGGLRRGFLGFSAAPNCLGVSAGQQ